MLDLFKYNNSFWDLVQILNNNNKSILMFFIMFFILINKKHNKNFNLLVKLNFLLVFYSINNQIDNFNMIFNLDNSININLTNGLILIHPICMYIVYLYFLLILLNFNYKNINKNLNIFKIYINNSLLFGLMALCLGGYWSQQELNWGGWWNWDFVEIIALIFFLISVLIIHINLTKNLNLFFYIFNKIINYYIIFFFIIRLDLINSIHSFNSFNKSNFNVNMLLFIYVVFIIIIVIINNNNYNKYYNNVKNNNVLTLLFLTLLFMFNLYIYINLIISFYYDTQFIELTKYLKKLINSLIFIVFYSIIKNKKLFLLSILIFFNNIYNMYFIISIIIIKIINNYKYNYKNVWHIFIIVFIIVNNFNYNFQYNLINSWLIYSNINLLNNMNILNNFQNFLMYFNYYNKNNYLNEINNYFCYNNNILFNSVFKETLLNNILLINNETIIKYKIEKTNIIFNFGFIYMFILYIIIIFINFINKIYKNNYIKLNLY